MGMKLLLLAEAVKLARFKLQPLVEPKKVKLFGALKGKIVFSADYDKADKEILEMFEESINNKE